MPEWISEIITWPAIIQGALGSLLCLLIVKLCSIFRQKYLNVRQGVEYKKIYKEYYWLTHLHSRCDTELRTFGGVAVLRKSMAYAFDGLALICIAAILPMPVGASVYGAALSCFIIARYELKPPATAHKSDAEIETRIKELRTLLGKDEVKSGDSPRISVDSQAIKD